MEARYRMLQRCLTVLKLLSERRWTLEGLARVCRVNERTIRRDLAALRKCGHAIWRDEESGLWRMERRGDTLIPSGSKFERTHNDLSWN